MTTPSVLTPSPSVQELTASHKSENLGSASSGTSSSGAIQFVPYDKFSQKNVEMEECRNKFRQFRLKNQKVDNDNQNTESVGGRQNGQSYGYNHMDKR